ncbi:MAG TPA: SDR family NAD(P)-dependent oxidoreductase, partial [Rhodanobacteraceae bacterium]|nr:SDR family NAD(P)-dependent oxidoreductase [Rhodanobacteraceae bacterium]
MKLKPLHQQTIVITGASSGIGLATAHMAAQAGARVVLTSRNDEVLAKVAGEIEGAGGEVIHVAADVAHREEVQKIADAAYKRFGGFDTWVNNAGVDIIGKL